MPIDSSAARNQFLATMATIVKQGGVSGAESMAKVAEAAAVDVAKGSEGVAPADLLAAMPDAWMKDPTGHTSRDQMNAFLQVAGPVLGVDLGLVSPLATRGVAAGQDIDAAITINKAREAAKAPNPVLDAVVDIKTVPTRELMQALEAAFKDPGFITSLGGQRMASMLRDVEREVATALEYSQPGPENEPVALAGGVPVSGPAVRKAWQERPNGMFRVLPLTTTVGDIARAAAELVAVRAGLDEIEMRSAIQGDEVKFMSGHSPPKDALPLHIALSAEGLGLGIGLDVQKLRAFHDNASASDEDVVKGVGGALRKEDAELSKFTGADMPVGFFLDARARKTKTVQDALQS